MQKRGVDVYMLTGDNKETARAVANQTGIQHFKAEILPSEFKKKKKKTNEILLDKVLIQKLYNSFP